MGVGSARSAIAEVHRGGHDAECRDGRAAHHGCTPAVPGALSGRGEAREQAGHDEKQEERDDEHEPPREGVEETRGRLRAIVVRQHTGAGDARGIRGNRNGNRRERDDRAHPGPRVREVAVQNAEREQGDQRSDAAAGLRHLEARVGEDDDVALPQDGHRARLNAGRPHARGEQLERERDLVEDDRRQGHHEQEEENREGQHTQVLPAVQE